MFLSTMQTPPNQIPLGPAEMNSLLSFSVEWGFYSCWICTCQDQKKVSVPKDFRLLGVWFTEFTLYQPFSISGFSFKNAHVEKGTWQGLCK